MQHAQRSTGEEDQASSMNDTQLTHLIHCAEARMRWQPKQDSVRGTNKQTVRDEEQERLGVHAHVLRRLEKERIRVGRFAH